MAAFARKRAVLNDKGVAVWFVLLIIAFVFLPFMVLTIDMAYVYYTRGQLHNAADAAALAGVSGLDGTNALEQAEARERAKKFASKNGAAGGRVLLNSDNSNTLSDTNDITVGNWNGTSYTAGTPPINAVQAVARRTNEKPDGRFGLMFGFAVGRSFMNIAGAAIASMPAKAEAPLALCTETCTPIPLDEDRILYLDPGASAPDNRKIAWTVFDDSNPVTPPLIKDLICEKKSVAACNKRVYTTMGIDQPAIKTLRCAFKDPTYDEINKTYDTYDGKVASWTVIVPIVRSINHPETPCPPSLSGMPNEPYEIVQYAEVTITEIYPGSSGGGVNYCDDKRPCTDYDDYNFLSPSGPDQIRNAIRISKINCVNCPEATTELLGRTPALVR